MKTPPFEELMYSYFSWVDRTFPDETPAEQLTHLREEVGELMDDIEHGKQRVAGEFADVLMLLLCVARNEGVDILKAFAEKLEVNKARTWERGEAGFRHVKEPVFVPQRPCCANRDNTEANPCPVCHCPF